MKLHDDRLLTPLAPVAWVVVSQLDRAPAHATI